jgi:hypothetical protein
MTTVRKSYANEIEKYLKDRPNRQILVKNMFDDLGMYSTRPSGKRAYNIGSFPLRQVLYGLPTSNSGMGEPMEGLEILTDLDTVPGGRGTGTAWTRVVLRYSPPLVVSPVTPAEPQVFEGVITEGPLVDLTQVHQQLDSILKQDIYTNRLLERLLQAWGDSAPTVANEVLSQWADDDEQVDEEG